MPALRRLSGVSVLLALVTVALAGACSDDKSAPAITAPPGYRVVADKDAGFAIAIPQDWEQLPLDLKTFDRVAGDIRAKNRALAFSLVQARDLANKGGKLLAVQPDAKSSVNLIVARIGKDEDFESIPQQSISKLLEVGAVNLVREDTTLGGRRAVKLMFRLPVETDTGTVQTDETQYYMFRGKDAFILTLAGPSPLLPEIANTLRIR